MPIGGAEGKLNDQTVLTHFVRLCGGDSARIVVITTASEIPDEVGASYRDIFTSLGASEVRVLNIRTREEADAHENLAFLDDVTGVFLSGGDQSRLTTAFNDTKAGARLLQLLSAGVTIGGTSAGASAMSQEMIADGHGGTVPSRSLVEMGLGLSLLPSVIFDQHFRQRQRIGRLLTVIALHPTLIGIGLDEDTALIISPDDSCKVIGSGSVTIVDGSALEYSDVDKIAHDELASVIGIKLHILTEGYRYNLETRQASKENAAKI